MKLKLIFINIGVSLAAQRNLLKLKVKFTNLKINCMSKKNAEPKKNKPTKKKSAAQKKADPKKKAR